METISKVRIRRELDPASVYPSERRYSASTVFGLSTVFLIFGICGIIMATLVLFKMAVPLSSPEANKTRLEEKVEKDIRESEASYKHFSLEALVSACCFLMSTAAFLTCATGIVAWKRWYIDHNITFFLITAFFSTLTSSICLLSVSLANFTSNLETDLTQGLTPSLAINISILSALTLIWSIISVKIGYSGMRNDYPEDINRRAHIPQHLPSLKFHDKLKNNPEAPPDILDHNKYLRTREN